MVKLSKEEKEQARVCLCGGLNEAYIHYYALGDIAALDVIAFCYRQSGMPNRSQQILGDIAQLKQVNKLTEDRKCVPNGGIIIDIADQTLAMEERHEIPSDQNSIGVPVRIGVDCLHSG